MKQISKHLLVLAGASLSLSAVAQDVDYTKYPDYTAVTKADPTLRARRGPTQRPDHVNNGESRCFPPVVNQDGGSCGSASRIYYMFTYEINAYRNADGKKPENQYPTHFTWLLTNSNSGKEGMARANGIPNSVTYGGNTFLVIKFAKAMISVGCKATTNGLKPCTTALAAQPISLSLLKQKKVVRL